MDIEGTRHLEELDAKPANENLAYGVRVRIQDSKGRMEQFAASSLGAEAPYAVLGTSSRTGMALLMSAALFDAEKPGEVKDMASFDPTKFRYPTLLLPMSLLESAFTKKGGVGSRIQAGREAFRATRLKNQNENRMRPGERVIIKDQRTWRHVMQYLGTDEIVIGSISHVRGFAQLIAKRDYVEGMTIPIESKKIPPGMPKTWGTPTRFIEVVPEEGNLN